MSQTQLLSLRDIRGLPARASIITLERAGDPLQPNKPVRRVSTAKWRGALLSDVVKLAHPLPDATHIWVDGADWGVYRPHTPVAERVTEYRKDLTLERIFRGDVLLAYEMNDEPLPADHGYPLRLIVPGYYGTNSVKWVNKLTIAHGRPSGLFCSRFYSSIDVIQDVIERRQVAEVKVNSFLTSPSAGDTLPLGIHKLVGWAWGAQEIARVEVKIDPDGLWREAKVGPRIDHSWQPFEVIWQASQAGSHAISVRATDVLGDSQPEDVHINQVAEIAIIVR